MEKEHETCWIFFVLFLGRGWWGERMGSRKGKCLNVLQLENDFQQKEDHQPPNSIRFLHAATAPCFSFPQAIAGASCASWIFRDLGILSRRRGTWRSGSWGWTRAFGWKAKKTGMSTSIWTITESVYESRGRYPLADGSVQKWAANGN